jgi:hypothetical protein
VAAVGYFALFHGISRLVPNFSATEIATQGSATSLRSIWEDPVNAPFKLLSWIPFKLGLHSIVWVRLIAAIIGACSALLFYFVLTQLFSKRVALLTTLLFIFSTGFLHASRLGTPLIMQIFGILLLMASAPLYMLTRFKILPIYISTAAIALLLYTPTMQWFIVVGGIVVLKAAKDVFKTLAIKHKILVPVFFLILIAPLAWHVIRMPLSALTLLGLPQQFPTLQEMGANMYAFGRSLVWSGTGPAEIMLVGAPILNVIEAGLIAAGIVTLIRSIKLRSNMFVASGLVLFIILVAFGATTYLPLVPFLFLLLAGGIFYLLSEWFDVFPLNPVANIIGTVAIGLVIGASVFFHIRSYYIAWPHSNATRHAFRYPQPTNYFPSASDTKETVRF